MLPALVALVALVCAAVAALAAVYRALGIGGLVVAMGLLTVMGATGWRRHRPVARRRLGYYKPEEIAELDTRGLVLAVSRMLRRDGWRVLPMPEADRPRLCARDARGRRLEVAFRPVAEPLPDEDTSASAGAGAEGRPRSGPHWRLVVHRGSFSGRDAHWARRRDDIRLIDGPLLERWGSGTPLREL
ncbi:hypothetical protein FNH08_32700 [Streptomyces spongiae]|uniref:Restriction endonuclease n=1 Tax=Streptomyces spongiae TaxID=565072 RepID=A0A5N8XRD9_9ACTN|nr:hypothetical protein [Streptomyces spongiae]